MSKDALLTQMTNLLLTKLQNLCLSHSMDVDRGRTSFNLINGTMIHIRFNNYDQYSYVIQFSSRKLDRVRFDNYDEHWDVGSKPHHTHSRNSEIVTDSQMTGQPELDSNLLIQTLRQETKLLQGH